MKTRYTRSFATAAKHLSTKGLESLQRTLTEVKAANTINEITDCRKLVGYDNASRIRVGSPAPFFTILIEIVDDTVFFRYLVPRGQAYDKRMPTLLRAADNE